MSFKYAVVKEGENHYVLPKLGDMQVEAHAFLSEELYRATEEVVWRQIAAGKRATRGSWGSSART
jgi:hypothetical protein